MRLDDWLSWMEDRETPRMRKYGESRTTWIMMATLLHVTSGSGLRKFQADGFLFNRVYNYFSAQSTQHWVLAFPTIHKQPLALLHYYGTDSLSRCSHGPKKWLSNNARSRLFGAWPINSQWNVCNNSCLTCTVRVPFLY